LKKDLSKIKLRTYDELFETDEGRAERLKEKVTDIPIDQIDDFPEHPFKVRIDESMHEMAESIKRFGVLTPAAVIQKENGRYELISGHRRKKACELSGVETLPCIVKEMTRDEAIIFMVDSNLQREQILPSEKAFSYKMRLEAMNRQGERTDLTSAPLESKLRSNEILASLTGESRPQIQRYIRLTELVPDVLSMVDEKEIAFQPAVEISYLKKNEQEILLQTIETEEATPSLSQAQRMKKLSKEGRLNEDVIFSIMTEEKANQKEKIVLKDDRFNKYFPKNFSNQQKEELLAKLLENWWRKQREQER